ncbi:unnamed protein product [Leptidea sinapis]|uniref:Uncharacterized protein n=1 Tax=Leptidea sinapis TaxID=189913 RepID=A0A5E4R8Q7_9NEOP|nr:unnamed protein product [Leptidea sinapis]
MKTKTSKKKCICDTEAVLRQITGSPQPIDWSELNNINLNLFTERNSVGTRNLILKGKDLYERYKRRITDSDVKAICQYVKLSPKRITKLELPYNEITDIGFFKLLKQILVKERSSITYLNIMNNNISEISILNLSKYAEFVKLKHLRLNGNDFGTKGGEYLAQFFKRNKSVEVCDIGQADQTLTSVAHLMDALRIDSGANNTLTVLDLSRVIPLFNRYSYETKWMAYHIENLLRQNKTLVELRLQKNEMIGHDMTYIVRGLRNNNTLLYLDLGYNRIGEYGTEVLAKYLAENPELRLLNLTGNTIKDTGAKALSLRMPFSKLRALNIANNKISNMGILDLLNTLKKPFYMRYFNIFGNEIGGSSCEVIERMLMSGVLFQDTTDVRLYSVDGSLYAAYYPNPFDLNSKLYYCEMDFGFPIPIDHIKRNVMPVKNIIDVGSKPIIGKQIEIISEN